MIRYGSVWQLGTQGVLPHTILSSLFLQLGTAPYHRGHSDRWGSTIQQLPLTVRQSTPSLKMPEYDNFELRVGWPGMMAEYDNFVQREWRSSLWKQRNNSYLRRLTPQLGGVNLILLRSILQVGRYKTLTTNQITDPMEYDTISLRVRRNAAKVQRLTLT